MMHVEFLINYTYHLIFRLILLISYQFYVKVSLSSHYRKLGNLAHNCIK